MKCSFLSPSGNQAGANTPEEGTNLKGDTKCSEVQGSGIRLPFGMEAGLRQERRGVAQGAPAQKRRAHAQNRVREHLGDPTSTLTAL